MYIHAVESNTISLTSVDNMLLGIDCADPIMQLPSTDDLIIYHNQ